MSPCNSIAGLYFEGTCDIISVTMATHKVHKNVQSILVFVNYLEKLIQWPTIFISFRQYGKNLSSRIKYI